MAVFTSSENKVKDAQRLGADEVVLTKNPENLKKFTNSLNFIIDTVSASHDLDAYLQLLTLDGTLCLVGVPEHPHPSPNVSHLIHKRRQLAGSLIGGIKETQEMLDFCAKHHLVADIELIPIQKINEAYDRMVKNDVKYRFVIDLASLKK